eukprot:CAMPEP_0196584576 /NCGR_PEP_ID=MMETSP1081-20130531/47632_1 /TAXON_ID=36882 /ORGANISM="Pyramimonas amylifera, Strain CCMP720" /LENGTH=200 /DNA_ID=CAMNT_0041905829 /DNA_START=34 /DNA_END=636 /DNA_ORIENTATION=+
MASVQLKALRKRAQKKHLDFLLEDLYVEYKDTCEQTERENRGDFSGGRTALKQVDDFALVDTHQQSSSETFDPPYLERGVEAREMARMVNERRTPSGNFFQITNPSLFVQRVPGTNQMMSAPGTPAGHQSKTPPQSRNRPENLPPIAEVGHRAPAAQSAKPKEQSWLTPAQRRDRVAGMKNAKLVNAKRTPTGGFFSQEP